MITSNTTVQRAIVKWISQCFQCEFAGNLKLHFHFKIAMTTFTIFNCILYFVSTYGGEILMLSSNILNKYPTLFWPNYMKHEELGAESIKSVHDAPTSKPFHKTIHCDCLHCFGDNNNMFGIYFSLWWYSSFWGLPVNSLT